MRARRRAAFTLVEVLVAAAIAVLFFAVVTQVFLSQARMNQRAEAWSGALEASLVLEYSLARDLRALAAAPDKPPVEVSADERAIRFPIARDGLSTVETVVYTLDAREGGDRLLRNGTLLFDAPVEHLRFRLVRAGRTTCLAVDLAVTLEGTRYGTSPEQNRCESTILLQVCAPEHFLGAPPLPSGPTT